MSKQGMSIQVDSVVCFPTIMVGLTSCMAAVEKRLYRAWGVGILKTMDRLAINALCEIVENSYFLESAKGIA